MCATVESIEAGAERMALGAFVVVAVVVVAGVLGTRNLFHAAGDVCFWYLSRCRTFSEKMAILRESC